MDLSTREGRREQGRLIQQAIEAAGLSLDDLARAIGCSRALVYQYVSGATLAQPDRVQQIAHCTGQTLAHFYGGDLTPEAVRTQIEAVRAREEQLAAEREEFRRRRLEDGLAAMRALAQAQSDPPDPRALLSTCEQIATLARELDQREVEAEAALRLGNACLELCDLDGARRALQRAVDLARQAEDGVCELAARQSLGHALLALGHVEDALAQFQAVAASPDWWNRWQGTLSIGAVYEQTGDYPAAMQQLEQTDQLLAQAPDAEAAATARAYLAANWANLYLNGGDYSGAARLAEEALSTAEQIGSRDQYIEGHINLGACAYARGDLPGAVSALRRATALSRCTGDAGRQAVARACLSRTLTALGQFDSAREAGKDAAREALRIGSRRAELLAETALAESHLAAGLARDALYHCERALEVARGMRAGREQAELLVLRGRCRRGLGEAGTARADAEAGLALARELGTRPVETEALLAVGWLAVDGGDPAPAGERAAEAGMLAATMDSPELLRRVNLLSGAASLLQQRPADALAPLQEAVAVIEKSRSDARRAGLEDTLLEDPERRSAFLALHRALSQLGRAAEADQVIEDAAWPPLREAVRR